MNDMNTMVHGNLALAIDTVAPAGRNDFHVIEGGLNQKRTPASRSTIAGAIVISLVALVFVFGFFTIRNSTLSAAADNTTYESIRVKAGESLWTLAEQHEVEGLTTQQTSDLIRSVNHLQAGSLQQGQTLRVPSRH